MLGSWEQEERGWLGGLERIRDSEALAKSEKSEYVTTNEWTLQ